MATSPVLAITTLFFLSTIISAIDATSKVGFSVEIIHRDSINSPFYNPNETPTQRLANAFRRSMYRINHFSPSSIYSQSAESQLISNRGEYLMRVSIGTPAFEILAIADTGSDLIWTQCEPCDSCYPQDAPLFVPKNSSTYKDISCSTSLCQTIEQASCANRNRNSVCMYSYSYGDRSFTNGNLATDTITLGSTTGRPVSFPKFVFGCGHNNEGTFAKEGSGLVGLGGGSISLISQLGSSIDGKFSYCLVPLQSTGNSSKLNFGQNGVVSGAGVQSTPLVFGTSNTFYLLTLEAISVEDRRIEFGGSSFGTSSGNIVIDSGTTLTLLPQGVFSELVNLVDNAIGAPRVNDPSGILQLCYSTESNINLPILTAHFSGADLKLSPMNTFVQVSDTVICFAFSSISRGAIYGNLAQMNYLVGYDLQAKTVSFKQTDCTRQ